MFSSFAGSVGSIGFYAGSIKIFPLKRVTIINLIRFTHTIFLKAIGDDDINVNIVSSVYDEIKHTLSKVFKTCKEIISTYNLLETCM